MNTTEKIRLDKWLWYARFFKSRTVAAKQINAGKIRVNQKPIKKAKALVHPGDVLTFAQGAHIRVIEIIALGNRRGPAPEARELYKDLDPPEARTSGSRPLPAAARDPGAGRPTKKHRRAVDRLKAWLGISIK